MTLNKRMALSFVFAATLVILCLGARLFWVSQWNEAATDLKAGRGQEAMARLEVLAKLGSRKALILAGNAYAYGWGGMRKDRVLAASYLARADRGCSKKQSARACGTEEVAIAEAYATGTNGASLDPGEAQYWAEIAKLRRSDH
jgi:hypothetical protein